MDDDLLRDAKRYAAETGKTLTAVIEDALRQSLRRSQPRVSPQRRIKLRIAGRGGIMPGIDLDDSASLVDAMDRRA